MPSTATHPSALPAPPPSCSGALSSSLSTPFGYFHRIATHSFVLPSSLSSPTHGSGFNPPVSLMDVGNCRGRVQSESQSQGRTGRARKSRARQTRLGYSDYQDDKTIGHWSTDRDGLQLPPPLPPKPAFLPPPLTRKTAAHARDFAATASSPTPTAYPEHLGVADPVEALSEFIVSSATAGVGDCSNSVQQQQQQQLAHVHTPVTPHCLPDRLAPVLTGSVRRPLILALPSSVSYPAATNQVYYDHNLRAGSPQQQQSPRLASLPSTSLFASPPPRRTSLQPNVMPLFPRPLVPSASSSTASSSYSPPPASQNSTTAPAPASNAVSAFVPTPKSLKRVSSRLHTVASSATHRYGPAIVEASRSWGKKGKERIEGHHRNNTELGLKGLATARGWGSNGIHIVGLGTGPRMATAGQPEDERPQSPAQSVRSGVLPSGPNTASDVHPSASPWASAPAPNYGGGGSGSSSSSVKLPASILGVKVPNRRGVAFGQPLRSCVEATTTKEAARSSASGSSRYSASSSCSGPSPPTPTTLSMKLKRDSANSREIARMSAEARMGWEETGALDREMKAWLPSIVVRCIEYLNEWGKSEEGIYRVPGRSKDVERLRALFDAGCDIDLRKHKADFLDPHAVASVFKLWLREVPDSLLSHGAQGIVDELFWKYKGHPAILPQGLGAFPIVAPPSPSPPSPEEAELIPALAHVFATTLPPENWHLLRAVTGHLALLSRHADTNRMTLGNLRLILSPTLRFTHPFLQLIVEERATLFAGPHILASGKPSPLPSPAPSPGPAPPHSPWSAISMVEAMSQPQPPSKRANSAKPIAPALESTTAKSGSPLATSLFPPSTGSLGEPSSGSTEHLRPHSAASNNSSPTPIADRFRKSVYNVRDKPLSTPASTPPPAATSLPKPRPYVPLRTGTGWSTARAGTDERPVRKATISESRRPARRAVAATMEKQVPPPETPKRRSGTFSVYSILSETSPNRGVGTHATIPIAWSGTRSRAASVASSHFPADAMRESMWPPPLPDLPDALPPLPHRPTSVGMLSQFSEGSATEPSVSAGYRRSTVSTATSRRSSGLARTSTVDSISTHTKRGTSETGQTSVASRFSRPPQLDLPALTSLKCAGTRDSEAALGSWLSIEERNTLFNQ